MASTLQRYKNAETRLLGIIGDEDTVTGFLLAGVGDNRSPSAQVHRASALGDGSKDEHTNFFVVTPTTSLSDIEEAFRRISKRRDIGIIIICQHIANDIRHLIQAQTETIPCVIEIPTRGQKYNAEEDYVLQKLNRAMGLR